MAVRRKLGNLAQVLLQSHLRSREDEFQADLVRKRQEELSRQNFEQTVLGRLVQDPKMAQRLRDSGQREVAGFNTDLFVPSQDEALGEVAGKIQAAPDKFDPLSIINQYNATPGAASGPEARAPIEQLIQQRNSAFERGKMTTPRVSVAEKLPDGSTQSRYINPAMQEEPIQTGLSAEQEGSNKLVSWEQFEGSPEYQKNQVRFGARQAASNAGAAQSAQLAAEARFYSSAEGKALLNSKTQAHLAQARSQAEGAAIVKAAEASARFLPNIIELEKKWQAAQPDIAKLVEGGVLNSEFMDILQARGVQALPLSIQQAMSPNVRQYFEMRGSYLPIFARVLSEVGNLNEQEQLRAAGLAPSGLDALNGGAAGSEKMARLKRLLITMPDIQAVTFKAMNGNASPEEREALIRDIIGIDEVTPPADPNSPEERFKRLELQMSGIGPTRSH